MKFLAYMLLYLKCSDPKTYLGDQQASFQQLEQRPLKYHLYEVWSTSNYRSQRKNNVANQH